MSERAKYHEVTPRFADFEERNDDCYKCPFFDNECSSGKRCFSADILELLERGWRSMSDSEVINDDLISRSEAIKAVERRESMMTGDKRVGVDSIKNFLRNRPTANVAVVRHAQWTKDGRCTYCGEQAPFFAMTFTHFKPPHCYRCGAKMEDPDYPPST